MKRVEQTLLDQMRMSDIEIARRKTLLSFSDLDVRLLKECISPIEKELENIVAVFYDQQTSIPEIALLIGDADTLTRLHNAQRKYITDLFSGFYDSEYVNNRLRIGLVHKRIGVEPTLYLSAMKALKELLIGALAQHINDPAKLTQTIAALEKLIYFDTTLVFDMYIRSLLGEIESAKDRAELYARGLEEKVAERTQQLAELARRDPLTELYNHRTLMEFLRRDLLLAKRQNKPISLIYFDVDNFKTINDERGHQAGNEVLRMISDCIKVVLRETDVPCRYGGDEFCVILPECGSDDAKLLCQRFLKIVEDQDPNITLSIGIAQTGPSEFLEPEEFIMVADQRMYESKKQPGSVISFSASAAS